MNVRNGCDFCILYGNIFMDNLWKILDIAGDWKIK